jgi:molybdenum cofactor cytidylyltransferase
MPEQHRRGLQNMTGEDVAGGTGYAAIILAAGAGRRFGGGKLLAPWRGAPLVSGALKTALATPSDQVVVVTGTDAAAVEEACRAAAGPDAEIGRLRFLHAADHEEGMGASLRAGAASLAPGFKGVFVFLGDMPEIPPDIIAPLIAAVEAGAPAAAPQYKGRRGHPVLFSPDAAAGLAGARGDAGARDILKQLGDQVARIPSPSPGVLFDVDRPGDLDRPFGD